MGRLMDVLTALRAADAQPGDWYGWATNQAGHFALVGVPLAFLALWIELPSYAIPAAVAAVYGVVWEWLIQRGKDRADSLMDTAMVACGAALVVALLNDIHEALRVFSVYAALTAYGVGRRL